MHVLMTAFGQLVLLKRLSELVPTLQSLLSSIHVKHTFAHGCTLLGQGVAPTRNEVKLGREDVNNEENVEQTRCNGRSGAVHTEDAARNPEDIRKERLSVDCGMGKGRTSLGRRHRPRVNHMMPGRKHHRPWRVVQYTCHPITQSGHVIRTGHRDSVATMVAGRNTCVQS